MTKKKSKFFTFCCSLIPGAGEMYLGFLKQGISIMTTFFLIFVVAGILFPPLISFCVYSSAFSVLFQPVKEK